MEGNAPDEEYSCFEPSNELQLADVQPLCVAVASRCAIGELSGVSGRLLLLLLCALLLVLASALDLAVPCSCKQQLRFADFCTVMTRRRFTAWVHTASRACHQHQLTGTRRLAYAAREVQSHRNTQSIKFVHSKLYAASLVFASCERGVSKLPCATRGHTARCMLTRSILLHVHVHLFRSPGQADCGQRNFAAAQVPRVGPYAALGDAVCQAC